jgi:hypothetical protein
MGIIGLAIVAATAFGVWSASTVTQSRLGKGGCACGVGSDLTACDYVALASRRNTGRILLSDIAASELLVIALPAPPGCDGDHIAPDTVRANVPWRWSQSEGFGQCSLLERLQSSPR